MTPEQFKSLGPGSLVQPNDPYAFRVVSTLDGHSAVESQGSITATNFRDWYLVSTPPEPPEAIEAGTTMFLHWRPGVEGQTFIAYATRAKSVQCKYSLRGQGRNRYTAYWTKKLDNEKSTLMLGAGSLEDVQEICQSHWERIR